MGASANRGRVLRKQSREQGWFRSCDRRTGTCARSSKLVSNHVFTLSLINFEMGSKL